MRFDEHKLKSVIVSALELPPEQYSPDLAFGQVETWDSLGHVNLMFSIEDSFGIKFDSTEMPDLKSVEKIQKAIERRLAPPLDTQ